MSKKRKKQKAGATPPARFQVPAAAVYLALGVILLLGWYVRFEDWSAWKQHPELFSFQGEPVLINADGYFYLRLARDLTEGTYTAVDPLRTWPDHPNRPSPPPLLSFLTALLYKLLPFSFERIAILIPALLGPLIALPLFFLSRLLGGGNVMGLTASLAGVLSVQYVARTRMGFYDTDCMIVFFSLMAALCSFLFAREQTRKRYYFLAGWGVVLLLFMWWWHMAIQVVTAICFIPMGVALVFYYRPTRQEALRLIGGCAALLLVSLILIGMERLQTLIEGFTSLITFVIGRPDGAFPNSAGDIAELQAPPFSEVISLTTGSLPVFLAAIAGLGWLFVARWKEALFLGAPVALAFASLFLGNRFLIFFAPVIAIGLGYLVFRLAGWGERHGTPARVALALLVMFAMVPAFRSATRKLSGPITLDTWPGIAMTLKDTPEDAVIWSSWNVGYPLLYYASRGVIGDGQSLEGERLAYAALPLSVEDPRLAANFIHFYVKNGMAGLHAFYSAGGGARQGYPLLLRLLAQGPENAAKLLDEVLGDGRLQPMDRIVSPEQWLTFLFPPDNPPIFLLLHKEMTRSTRWFWYGRWDMQEQTGLDSIYKPFFALKEENGRIGDRSGFSFAREKGGRFQVDVDGRSGSYQLTHLMEHNGQKLEQLDYGVAEGLRFEWVKTARYGAMMDENIAESVFNKLFIRHSIPPSYFRHRALDSPRAQLWQVSGDGMNHQTSE